MKRIAALCIAAMLLVTGCTQESDTTADPAVPAAPAVVSVAGMHRYGYRAIEPPEGKVFRKRFAFGTVIGNSYLLGDRLYLECLPTGQPEAGEICYAEYDAEGVFVALHEIALPEEIYDAVIDGEGRIVGVTETEVATLLRRYDPDTLRSNVKTRSWESKRRVLCCWRERCTRCLSNRTA